MADPKRLVVLKAITAVLQQITPANGYQHDLSGPGRVARGRLTFGDNAPLPMVALNEPLNPDREARRAGSTGHLSREVWSILVQGWAADDWENPTDPAHLLMADVKKALATVNVEGHANYRLVRPGWPSGLVGRIQLEPGTVRPPEPGVSDKAFFFLHADVEFVENTLDPYGS